MLTSADRIQLYPWYNTAEHDFVVTVNVVRFEQQREQEVRLIARWALRTGTGQQLDARDTDLRRAAATAEETAAAMSDLTAALAGEIAEAIGKARRR